MFDIFKPKANKFTSFKEVFKAIADKYSGRVNCGEEGKYEQLTLECTFEGYKFELRFGNLAMNNQVSFFGFIITCQIKDTVEMAVYKKFYKPLTNMGKVCLQSGSKDFDGKTYILTDGSNTAKSLIERPSFQEAVAKMHTKCNLFFIRNQQIMFFELLDKAKLESGEIESIMFLISKLAGVIS